MSPGRCWPVKAAPSGTGDAVSIGLVRTNSSSAEKQVQVWRAHLRKNQAITSQDAAELEDHLREQVESLRKEGLSEDEAFRARWAIYPPPSHRVSSNQ